MRTLVWRCVAFWALSLLFFTGPKDGKADLIKLGAIVSLSGPAADKGRNWLEGAILAAERLAAEGQPVQLLVEDDGTLPVRTVSAFTKLATLDKVSAIIGGTWDFLAEASYPLAKRYQVPFLTPTNPLEIISQEAQQNPWIYTNSLSLAAEKEAMAALLKRLKPASLAAAYIDVPYGQSHATLLKELGAELKIKLLFSTPIVYEGFVDSIKAAALKTAAQKPDLIFLITDAQGTDLFTRELARLRGNPHLLVTLALDEAYKLAADHTRYQKAYGIYPYYQSKEFEQAFVKRFGYAPKDFAGSGYDAVMFLASALRAGVKLNSPAAAFSCVGITGEHKLPSNGKSLVQAQAQVMSTKTGAFAPFLVPPF